MTDQTSNNSSGTPAAPGPSGPAPAPPEMAGSSYIATRSRQMAEKMQPAGEQPAQPAPDAGTQQQQQQQQQPPAKIKIGDIEYDAADVTAALAAKAEADNRKSGLPQSPEAFEARNSANFKLPDEIGGWQFDQNDPNLAAARRYAHANGLTQQQFEGMLDLYVASRANELMQAARARQQNLDALGAASSSLRPNSCGVMKN